MIYTFSLVFVVDDDPDYRATRVRSGIPPPSMRDIRHQNNQNLSTYNPAMQRPLQCHTPYDHPQRYAPQHHEPPAPPAARSNHAQYQGASQSQSIVHPAMKPKPLDFRTNTDFMTCETRLGLTDLNNILQSPESDVIDYDFLTSASLVESVNKLREKMRLMPKEFYMAARAKSNPFERIGTSHFLNRAATKIAALDALFGLTKANGAGAFRFVDVCGGPGGFSEYLMWRVQSWGGKAEGYGITLPTTGEMNWQVDKFCVPSQQFVAVEGDVCREEERKRFEKVVGEVVDLVVADGAIDFAGREDQQERLMYPLLLSEILIMLASLRKGGTFVCKMFDMLSNATGSLVWLLYELFEEVCITKPLSSRPANAERYVVCKSLIHQQPRQLMEKLAKATDKGVVQRSVYENDETFVDYIRMRNMKFAMKQMEALEMIGKYIENSEMAPLYDQELVKRHCLTEWRLSY
ncbi:MAG: FtsJ-like methyltransferase-domain-containing protein [Benjaminiella poitrasii]|nr:MAG: FtsJ-like methyltransferase-domain-containing protein [Benjaminiella poitrasii]